MNVDAKVYVAGHRGLVGSAIVRELERKGYTNLITASRDELDLTDQAATITWFEANRPQYVFLAAAKVGGIGANSASPAQFIAENLSIALNVIDASYRSGVVKLCNLGSSCIYPREADQPLAEEALLTGALEPTNEPYAIAKIAAIKLCQSYNAQYNTNYISLMPTNLYGPGDNYDLETSHVLPALIARFHRAKCVGDAKVTLWGDGSPLREFLYVDDLARAAVFMMKTYDVDALYPWINVGSGDEVTIERLATMVRDIVFADADTPLPTIAWDTTKPNGTPRKLLDSTRINELGWQATTSLQEGIARAYEAFVHDSDSNDTAYIHAVSARKN